MDGDLKQIMNLLSNIINVPKGAPVSNMVFDCIQYTLNKVIVFIDDYSCENAFSNNASGGNSNQLFFFY